ncbi:MAG: hypothetical protein AAFQ82_14495 [Myxococcota bacterium]
MVTKRALLPSLVTVAMMTTTPAWAAEITDVADALDVENIGTLVREDPFDFDLAVGFRSIMESGKITREPFDRPGISSNCSESNPFGCGAVDELEYDRNTSLLEFEAEFGLFRDLSLAVGWSYVLSQSLAFTYADGVTATNSSVDPQTGNPDDSLFANNFESENSGSGPLLLSLRWAPLNDARDVTRPTWLLFFDWSSPWVQSTFDPRERATSSNPGPVGDGVHRLTIGTAFSKRLGNFGRDIEIDPTANRRGYFDPYFSLSYTIPLPEDGLALDDLVETRTNPFGRRPSSELNAKIGLEIVPLEDLRNQRKFSIDIGLDTSMFTDGRNYSLLTNPLQELTFEEQHARFLGRIGLYVQAAEFLKFQGLFNFGYVTEHFLTFEDVGEDRNGDGQVLENSEDLFNPYFCRNQSSDICATKGQPSVDQVGFRFKDEEHLVLSWFIRAILTF